MYLENIENLSERYQEITRKQPEKYRKFFQFIGYYL